MINPGIAIIAVLLIVAIVMIGRITALPRRELVWTRPAGGCIVRLGARRADAARTSPVGPRHLTPTVAELDPLSRTVRVW